MSSPWCRMLGPSALAAGRRAVVRPASGRRMAGPPPPGGPDAVQRRRQDPGGFAAGGSRARPPDGLESPPSRPPESPTAIGCRMGEGRAPRRSDGNHRWPVIGSAGDRRRGDGTEGPPRRRRSRRRRWRRETPTSARRRVFAAPPAVRATPSRPSSSRWSAGFPAPERWPLRLEIRLPTADGWIVAPERIAPASAFGENPGARLSDGREIVAGALGWKPGRSVVG